MNEEEIEKLKSLTADNYIWVAYILLAIANIYGDELIRKSITEHDGELNKKALKLFREIVVINLIIYLYFLNRNYKDLKRHDYDKNYLVRLFGSILVFAGTICFLYFQYSISSEDESLSNV